MSKETRSSSALFKRAEQLKRYEESELNRELPVVSNSNRRIKFSSDCVFLAACAAGDKEEVERLLREGADIDTANVDGLTSLHQACIDDNLDMVEFLVERGADVNRGDNEGWTPLHATASCGFVSIAKYLIENGADVAIVNNDGDLSLDIADSVEMEDLLQGELNHRGINCEEARKQEERMMLSDAKEWLSSGELNDTPHPKTGATALHVAAAKGYIKVMELLLEGGADVNAQDLDGWTPLHAAAHWGQKDAAELLTKHHCIMDMKNYVGQTPFDVAENAMTIALQDMQQKQNQMAKERIYSSPIKKKDKEKEKEKEKEREKTLMSEPEPTTPPQQPTDNTPDLVPKVKVEIKPSITDDDTVEKKNKANKDETPRIPTSAPEVKVPNISSPPSLPPKQSVIDNNEDGAIPSWRRPGSFRNRGGETTPNKLTLRIGEKEVGGKVTSPVSGVPTDLTNANEVSLRRTQSFEADEKFYRRYLELRAKINAGNSCPALHGQTQPTAHAHTPAASSHHPHAHHLPTRSASLKEKHYTRCLNARRLTSPTSASSPPLPSATVTMATTTTATTTTAHTTTGNTTTVPHQTTTTHIRRSFVPPVRDEESETQRKAHAKRVRETRRSTQGVTLDEIKSAEQLVKQKQHVNNNNNNNQQFQLEDARTANSEPSSEQVVLRRGSGGLGTARAPTSSSTTSSTTSSPTSPTTDTAEATVTLPLRKQNTKLADHNANDREGDKENDARSAQGGQATQAVIQRRRRPKRRSTGVVHVDMDEIDPDRQDGSGGGGGGQEETHCNSSESGEEKSQRLNSTSSDGDRAATENGELDYKKLYEESILENERLRDKLRKTEGDLQDVKSRLENTTNNSTKLSLSEMEKRERRAMERKLSEMEEELKQLVQLRNDNQKLKDENGALIRVISKLSK